MELANIGCRLLCHFRELARSFQARRLSVSRPCMTDLITEIWAGLKDAGMPDVMLYLPDGSACRCHWDETALIGDVRVALLADQDRKIVRIMPVHECTGIGIASPKGTDPAGYRTVVQAKLKEQFEGEHTVQSPET